MDRENRAAAIVRSVEQRLQFQLFHRALELLQFRRYFFLGPGVFLQHFHQLCKIIAGMDGMFEGFDNSLERFQFLNDLLSLV